MLNNGKNLPHFLPISWPGDSMLYALFRALPSMAVWDADAKKGCGELAKVFEPEKLENYEVMLREAGGNLFLLDVPIKLPAGSWHVQIYEKIGPTPRTSDLLIASGSLRTRSQGEPAQWHCEYLHQQRGPLVYA
jgi:hypothetical protein